MCGSIVLDPPWRWCAFLGLVGRVRSLSTDPAPRDTGADRSYDGIKPRWRPKWQFSRRPPNAPYRLVHKLRPLVAVACLVRGERPYLRCDRGSRASSYWSWPNLRQSKPVFDHGFASFTNSAPKAVFRCFKRSTTRGAEYKSSLSVRKAPDKPP